MQCHAGPYSASNSWPKRKKKIEFLVQKIFIKKRKRNMIVDAKRSSLSWGTWPGGWDWASSSPRDSRWGVIWCNGRHAPASPPACPPISAVHLDQRPPPPASPRSPEAWSPPAMATWAVGLGPPGVAGWASRLLVSFFLFRPPSLPPSLASPWKWVRMS